MIEQFHLKRELLECCFEDLGPKQLARDYNDTFMVNCMYLQVIEDYLWTMNYEA